MAPSGMIPLEEAQARLLAMAVPVEVETVALAEATDRWLAEDVLARRMQPARNLSAMDGFAFCSSDRLSTWTVIGESAAGRPFPGRVAEGEAARIFTGAALPDGADTVIIQENISRDGDIIRQIDGVPPVKAQHIRMAGSDFKAGDTLVMAGTRLNAPQIALAAMGGYPALPVCRKIKIAILSTGDELVLPGEDPGDDKIPSSNAIMLAAMLSDWPVEITDFGIIADSLDAIIAAIKTASSADIVVTSGGASVGDHDLVRPALIAAGAEIDFWKVAMRPGKPLMFGKLGKSCTLGLPGNPVSAFVTALLFLKPLVAALSGAASPLPARHNATLGSPLPAVGPRTDHIRACWQEGRVVPVGIDDSAALLSLSRAELLIVRDRGAAPANAGDMVEIISIA